MFSCQTVSSKTEVQTLILTCIWLLCLFVYYYLFISHQLYKIYEIGLLYILLLLLQFVNRGFTYLLTISLNHPAQLNVGLLQ